MKKFFAIFLTVIIVLCFVVSVYLYAENAELREQGSLKVFSPRAYFSALSEIEFPEYDFASTLISSSDVLTYTYSELNDMLTQHWYSRIFNTRHLQLLSATANLAVSGTYSSFTYRKTVYRVQEPTEPYSSVNDVLFYVEGPAGSYSDKIIYFFKYVGDCIKTVGEFIQAVLPFNDDYYTTLTLPNFGGNNE